MKYLLSTILIFASFSTFSQVDVPPPPPPPAPPEVSPEIFKVVEEMPRFPGCEDQKMDKKELEKCAINKLLSYISDNVEYPAKAKRDNKHGTAVVQFNVNTDGTLGNIKTTKDPGFGMGEAAADVVNKMNSDGIIWKPGKQRGKTVIVQYKLPVRFKKTEK